MTGKVTELVIRDSSGPAKAGGANKRNRRAGESAVAKKLWRTQSENRRQ